MVLSKKSQKFVNWMRECFGTECGVRPIELIVGLEEAARLVAKDVDVMGEPSKTSLHKLIRASKLIQMDYSDEV